jgi:hypothetical protein
VNRYRQVTCRNCGLERLHEAHGLCGACYGYQLRTGQPRPRALTQHQARPCATCGHLMAPRAIRDQCATCREHARWKTRRERHTRRYPVVCCVCQQRGHANDGWERVARPGRDGRHVCSTACRAVWDTWQVCRECGAPTVDYRGICKLHYLAARRLQQGCRPQPFHLACQECGRPRWRTLIRRGLCGTCYTRWHRARKREAVA